MSTALYFGDSSDSETDTPLPFPKPLDRDQFLTPSFSATDFLSTLQHRFQTLEDLQAELQDLAQNLNKELVDLVNDNYADFLSLGDRLRGGEERIEEIKVGLLGFQRDVGGVRDLVSQRSEDVRALLETKKALRRELLTGRSLLDLDERIADLETRLDLSKPAREPMSKDTAGSGEAEYRGEQIGGFHDWDDSWIRDDMTNSNSETSDDEEEDASAQARASYQLPRRLSRNLEQLQAIKLLSQRCGETHPFLLAQRSRIISIKEVLGKDLEREIRNQSSVEAKQRMIQLRSALDD